MGKRNSSSGSKPRLRPRQLRSHDLPSSAALHNHIHVYIAEQGSACPPCSTTSSSDPWTIATSSRKTRIRRPVEAIDTYRIFPDLRFSITSGFGGNIARFVILHIVVCEDARQFPHVAGDQSPISILKEPQDFLFVVHTISSPLRRVILSEVAAREANGHAVEESLPVNRSLVASGNSRITPSLLPRTAPWCTSKAPTPRRIDSHAPRARRPAVLAIIALPVATHAQSAASDKPFVVEYYYKTKWGHADEFLKLFKKNHYPVLKKESEMGRIAKVWMDQPRYHTTEDGRWDFRVTIVFKNATVANEAFDEAALQKQMYPDQETFQREEQRRFEILDAHWDLPIKTVDLDAKP